MNDLFKSLVIVTDDCFVFMDVTDKAKEIFQSGLFELYVIHEDSESLIESYADINDALENGLTIAIEVGHI
jgi:hypothetical protein